MNRREFIGGTAAALASGCVDMNLTAREVTGSAALEAAKKRFEVGVPCLQSPGNTISPPAWVSCEVAEFAAALSTNLRA